MEAGDWTVAGPNATLGQAAQATSGIASHEWDKLSL